MKKKNDKRPKKLIRQIQRDNCYITLIRKGRVVIQDGKPVKK